MKKTTHMFGGIFMHEKKDKVTEECIDACIKCARVCRETLAHCFSMDESHKGSNHLTLLMDCAEMCDMSASLMERGSGHSRHHCALCADACNQCAESCDAFDDSLMKNCTKVCRDCAEKCEKMTKKIK